LSDEGTRPPEFAPASPLDALPLARPVCGRHAAAGPSPGVVQAQRLRSDRLEFAPAALQPRAHPPIRRDGVVPAGLPGRSPRRVVRHLLSMPRRSAAKNNPTTSRSWPARNRHHSDHSLWAWAPGRSSRPRRRLPGQRVLAPVRTYEFAHRSPAGRGRVHRPGHSHHPHEGAVVRVRANPLSFRRRYANPIMAGGDVTDQGANARPRASRSTDLGCCSALCAGHSQGSPRIKRIRRS